MKSVQDYINPQEALRVLLNTIGAGSATQLGLTLVIALFSTADQWYTGPGGAVVVALLSAAAAAIAGKRTARHYLQQGEPIEAAKNPQPAKKAAE